MLLRYQKGANPGKFGGVKNASASAGLLAVACCVRLGLAVAIWAEHPYIFNAVIITNTVAMINLDRKRSSPPLGDRTLVANIAQ